MITSTQGRNNFDVLYFGYRSPIYGSIIISRYINQGIDRGKATFLTLRSVNVWTFKTDDF